MLSLSKHEPVKARDATRGPNSASGRLQCRHGAEIQNVMATTSLAARIARTDWNAIAERLDEQGFATTGTLLAADECGALASLYDDERRFRSRVVMAQHNFGVGEYKYFAYPLPKIVHTLRHSFYPHLAPIANRWADALGEEPLFPPTLDRYLENCHAAGQARPT